MDNTQKKAPRPALRTVWAIFYGLGSACVCAIPIVFFMGQIVDPPPASIDYHLGMIAAYFFISGFAASLFFSKDHGKPSLLEKTLLLPGLVPLIILLPVFCLESVFNLLQIHPPNRPWSEFLLPVLGLGCGWIVSLLGVLAGASIGHGPYRLRSFKTSLKVGLAVAMAASVSVAVFCSALPKLISSGDLSYDRVGSIEIKDKSLVATAAKGSSASQAYVNQLVLWNTGTVPLENLRVRLSFVAYGKDFDALQVFNVEHHVTPEDGFGSIRDEDERGRKTFVFERLRPGDHDTITFFTNCDTYYTVRAFANGSKINLQWLYDRKLVDPIFSSFLWAFMGAVAGGTYFWMRPMVPVQSRQSSEGCDSSPAKDAAVAELADNNAEPNEQSG